MHHTGTSLLSLIGRLIAVVFDALGMVVGALRELLEGLGIDGPIETLILVLVGVVVLLTAFQLLGRLFVVLLVVFVALLVLRFLLPPVTVHG